MLQMSDLRVQTYEMGFDWGNCIRSHYNSGQLLQCACSPSDAASGFCREQGKDKKGIAQVLLCVGKW